MRQSIGHASRQAWQFVTNDVWDIELASLPTFRRWWVALVRIVHLVIRGFHEDECPLHASALTFSTLMSIVPVLALALALARVFGGDELARQKIGSVVSEWTGRFVQVQEATDPVADVRVDGPSVPASPGKGWFRTSPVPPAGMRRDQSENLDGTELARRINRMVDEMFDRVANISFTALGGVGLVVLIWTVIQVLGTVEATFNRVWGVPVGRSLWRRFTDYLSVLVVLPFLMIAASSLPLVDFASRFLSDQYTGMLRSFLLSDAIKHVTVLGWTTMAFAFVLAFMPNTHVRVKSACLGGMVTSILFIAWLWICATIQLWVANYGRIYGSFALVPIILAWVYVSWQIILFGAEVAFSVQNWKTYRMEQGARRASIEARLHLALAVLVEAARAISTGSRPFDAQAFARRQGVPVRLLNEVIDDLVRAGLLGELSGETPGVVLCRLPDQVSVHDVGQALMQLGTAPAQLGLSSLDPRIQQALGLIVGTGTGVARLTLAELAADPA